jgi:hypothetical protein
MRILLFICFLRKTVHGCFSLCVNTDLINAKRCSPHNQPGNTGKNKNFNGHPLVRQIMFHLKLHAETSEMNHDRAPRPDSKSRECKGVSTRTYHQP